MRASLTSIATCDARASSLSTEATPPRVASRMQRSSGPASSSSASTTGHSERVSDSIVGVELELAAGEHDRRAVLADRARQQDAVARADRVGDRSGRAGRARRCRRCRRTCRRRRRARPPSCRRRRSPPRPPRAAAAIASTSAFRSSAARPSSRISDSVSARGRAPDTARSFTVPFTARSPIEPPGKRSGFTTNESVVNASAAPSISSGRGVLAPSARRRPARTGPRSCSAWPCRRRRGPCRCARSRNLPRFARAVSMISRMRSSLAAGHAHTTSRSRAKRPKL